MLANKYETEDRVNIFLATIGPQAFELLTTLVSPVDIADVAYGDLISELSSYYKPIRNEIWERHTFIERKQNTGESICEFILALKKLSVHCKFGGTLKERLRDQFVSGIRDTPIQRKLLSEKTLTFTKACELALSMEMADKDTKSLNSPHVKHVDRVTSGRKPQRRKQRHEKGSSDTSGKKCSRCNGTNHQSDDCFHKTKTCNVCKKVGHIGRACRSKRKPGYSKTNQVTAQEDEEETLYAIYATTRHHDSTNKMDEITVKVELEGVATNFILDTAASVSIIGETFYNEKLSHLPLRSTKVKLKSYSGDIIPVVGEIKVKVTYGEQSVFLPLIVAQGRKVALFGRSWLSDLKLNWSSLFSVRCDDTDDDVLKRECFGRYKSIFEGQGLIKDFKADVRVKSDSPPKFFKARPVPYSLRDKVEEELNRLEREGIVKKIENSEWAAPIVVVPKADSSIRICGDYKVTINQAIEDNVYPIPSAEDLFAKLAGAEVFTKIDLASAYNQVELTDEAKKLLVVNTHKGLYEFQRLSFGVSTAPAIFQAIMDTMLQGIDGVGVLMDDILIGTKKTEHDEKVHEVCQRLEKYGVKVKLSKCKFKVHKVEYLGHMIDADGIHPMESKVEAISKAEPPKNVSELRAFLGMVNYYGKFLPCMSTTLGPLYHLLKSDSEWEWSHEQETAFEKCKSLLASDSVLVHYDPNRQLTLACDASSYGIGCVISHIMDDGSERPIAYASRTLTKSERNYAQLEKEALSIVYGVKKFHKYLYGRKFLLITDHKPLTTLLGPKSGIPTLAAARLQRWALILMGHNYTIQYRRSEEHSNADALSRLPCGDSTEATEAEINSVAFTNNVPVSAKLIAEATRKDPLLSQVLDYTTRGWPNRVEDKELLPYYKRRTELSLEQGCLLWGMRVIIPPKYRNTMQQELHAEHTGVVRMKSMARSHFWYPGVDQEIENTAKSCHICCSMHNDAPTAPLHPWTYPSRVWERIHVDFAEFRSKNYLVIIDSRSKWLEVIPMTSTTAARTVEVLRTLFSSYGLPEVLVSDNGPQFIAAEFKSFLEENAVKHSLSPPYHPASNGAAERSVQIVKNALKKHFMAVRQEHEDPSITKKLANFLLTYRATPHSVTGVPPAELFLKRQLRTRLSVLKPDLNGRVKEAQENQQKFHDKRVSLREFDVNDSCYVKNFRGGEEKYVPGRITKRLGPLRYLVQIGRSTRYVHIDHLLPSNVNTECQDEQQALPLQTAIPDMVTVTSVPEMVKVTSVPEMVKVTSVPETVKVTSVPETVKVTSVPDRRPRPSPVTPDRRYPQRTRRPVKRFDV